jgi:hypothetical protein
VRSASALGGLPARCTVIIAQPEPPLWLRWRDIQSANFSCRSARSGPYAGGRRDYERICDTVGCDELPRCRARADFAFPFLAFHTQCAASQDRVQAAARVSPYIIDRRFKRAR